MAKAVIFDVDGTLVDTVDDLHASAWRDAFRDYGRDFDFAEGRTEIGKGGVAATGRTAYEAAFAAAFSARSASWLV